MVEWFKPTGRILEPCRGDDAIYNHMPSGADWCEVERGRDFFAWNEQVNWIISNPPYSIFDEWLTHSFEVSENSVYLISPGKLFMAHGRITRIRAAGWIKHVRFYGTGSGMGFPSGAEFAAFHFMRGYVGDTSWSWFTPPPPLTASSGFTRGRLQRVESTTESESEISK
jgi:hypothetical protein